ncbi:MAG: superoxide dismutase [Bacteroidetes bacterium]|nr:superoxide dismutase [Bacteroidota bacterium]
MERSRRKFIRNAALLTVAGAGLRLVGTQAFADSPQDDNGLLFKLPALPYAAAALEPYIDTQTMEIHHGKHHKAYVDNLNKALKGSGVTSDSLEDLMKNISKHGVAIRNNGGGHYNHSLFWKLMKPSGGGNPNGQIAEAINSSFGSFKIMQEQFNAAATSRFGSGWAWLIADKGKLSITSTPNQDNPLMDIAEVKGNPVLALDVWEHAYYLKYQNKRADYVNAFWNVVNWDEVNNLLKAVK